MPGKTRRHSSPASGKTDALRSAGDSRAQSLGLVSTLIFFSGMCALIYQVAWQREFRLIFGASTAASAAVIGIFIGGLGLGSLLLGRRADSSGRPLFMYGRLELGIAVFAALTPLLFAFARQVYSATGGTASLGLTAATIIRLLLACVILLPPTILMGGTLPAAGTSVASVNDGGRRRIGLLYSMNTLGAVTGAMLATFVLLEALGTRSTLWLAAIVNAVTAGVAMARARSAGMTDAPAAHIPAKFAARTSGDGLTLAGEAVPRSFVLAAAAAVGFAFFLMELVWYRMLGPILGGTVFTFGLILAVALLGVGIGGLVYALRRSAAPPTIGAFATTCLLEATAMLVPFACGDAIAVWTGRARATSAGFGQLVGLWGMVASFVILPAAVTAGYQFPMLIALLGRGKQNLGKHVGAAYAANTAGSIVGSLAGGFGLLPILAAQNCWRLAAGLLLVLGGTAGVMAWRQEKRVVRVLLFAVLSSAAVFCMISTGPTAAWRHSAIGAGRENIPPGWGNALEDWLRFRRRAILNEFEGIESSVGLQGSNGLNLIVNGKSDSNIKGDAQTVVWLGLLGAALHPNPKTALVVGLGTGATAGWLADVPGMERVDVAELEPRTRDVARACAAANRNVLDNPRVNLLWGDAREILLTSQQKYDIIVSEPSNPYRAGIASLFTKEFYAAAAETLNPGGLFLQWTQSYEIDDQTLATVYATLGSVFPEIESWMLVPTDLCFAASAAAREYDTAHLRERLAEEPFRSGLEKAWRVRNIEGFLGHFIGGTALARHVAGAAKRLNTDDRTIIEFGFARNVGRSYLMHDVALRQTALQLRANRPALRGAMPDWDAVVDEHAGVYTSYGTPPQQLPYFSADQRLRAEAQSRFATRDTTGTLSAWYAQSAPPRTATELAILAYSLADAGDARTSALLEQLRPLQPAEAHAIAARFEWRKGHEKRAAEELINAWRELRRDPWAWNSIMMHTFEVARAIAPSNKALAPELFAALKEPFAVYALNEARMNAMVRIGRLLEPVQIMEIWPQIEPHVPWQEEHLRLREKCYSATGDPRAPAAKKDLERFLSTAR